MPLVPPPKNERYQDPQRYDEFVRPYMRLYKGHHLPKCFYDTLERLFWTYVASFQDVNFLENNHRRLRLRMLGASLVAAQIHDLPLTLYDLLWKMGAFRCRIMDNMRLILEAEQKADRPVPEFSTTAQAQRNLLKRLAQNAGIEDPKELLVTSELIRRTYPKIMSRDGRLFVLITVKAFMNRTGDCSAIYYHTRTLIFCGLVHSPRAKKKCDQKIDLLVQRFEQKQRQMLEVK